VRKIIIFLAVFVFIFSLSSICWAGDPATPELTLQQAIDKAKGNSKSLQAAGYDVDRSYEVRKNASDSVTFIPAEGSQNPSADRAFIGLVQADLNWQMAKRNLSAQEDTLVMQVYQLYDGILQAQEKVKAAEVQLKNAERQRAVADASYRAGILNKMGLIQAQSAVEAAKTGLETAKKNLDDLYQNFNLLVGLEMKDRPVLVDRPEFSELKVDDLEVAVSRAVDQSPTVWLKEQQINLAKLALDLYNWNVPGTDPYEAKKYDMSKAEVSAQDTRDQMAKLVRSIYYSIKQLEEQYTSARESVKVAEENLRVTRVKYEVGMAIETDVIAAEASLAQAKQNLVDITCQHDILVYAFSKPWAYAASPSTSSGSSGSSK